MFVLLGKIEEIKLLTENKRIHEELIQKFLNINSLFISLFLLTVTFVYVRADPNNIPIRLFAEQLYDPNSVYLFSLFMSPPPITMILHSS